MGVVTSDGVADIIAGAVSGTAPHVKPFDEATGADRLFFLAFQPSSGGVRVNLADRILFGFFAVAANTRPRLCPTRERLVRGRYFVALKCRFAKSRNAFQSAGRTVWPLLW